MKRTLILSCLMLVVALNPVTAHAAMRLTSTDIQNDQALPKAQVFNNFGCTGDNISPQLAWEGVPEKTRVLL